MLAATTFARNEPASAAAAIAARVFRRATRKLLRSPSTWVLLAISVSLACLANVRPLQPSLAAPSRDAADQYVEALKTGDVDAFLASLSPEARTDLTLLGRFVGQPGTPAERRAARTIVARDHIDRYTRLGQHGIEDGSFVVYAIERDTPDGTHTQPLIVWLDQGGHVRRTTL